MRMIRRIPTLLVLTAAAAVSCRGPKVPVGIEDGALIRGGAGISVTATLPDDPEQIRKLFRAYPPDSGVVPVYVKVTNGDTAAVVLHHPMNLPLPDRFRGIVLDGGSGPIDPLHPLEALMRLAGKAEAPNYGQIQAQHVVGGLILPPLGVYYIYKWGGYALDYRPFLRNSFFPAGRGGSFKPVIIGPGETASGFLYFDLAPPASPYYTELVPAEKKRSEPKPVPKVRGTSGLELILRPAALPGPGRSQRPCAPEFEALGIRGIRNETSGCEDPRSGSSRDPLGAPRWDLLLLGRDRDTGAKLDLLIGSRRALVDSRTLAECVRVERVNNRSGELVDASRCGRFVACAVNFKQKSRLYSIDLGGAEPALAADLRLDRGVLRVFALPEGAYVVTDDGFCAVYRYEDLERTWRGRLGTSVSDAAFVEGRILAFGGDGVEEFACGGGRCDGPRRSEPARAGKVERGVRAGAAPLVVHRGAGSFGDTLVLYDPETLRERARLTLPGTMEAAAASGTAIAVQVEGGVLMRMETGAADGFSQIDAGWLPERARALLIDDRTGIFISPEHRLFTFGFDSIRPAPPFGGSGEPVRATVGIGPPGGKDR